MCQVSLKYKEQTEEANDDLKTPNSFTFLQNVTF